MNYYRKFIHNYAKVARPLHQLMSGENAKLKGTSVKWTEECEKSFLELKDLCSNTPVLAYPDYTKNFKIYTDASESGLRAVLTNGERRWKRITYRLCEQNFVQIRAKL